MKISLMYNNKNEKVYEFKLIGNLSLIKYY